MISLKIQAIKTALMGKWKTAITLNLALLKENPKDIETLNRLGYAFSAIGKIKDAKATYQKVLTLDTHNPIAIRNLKRLTEVKRGRVKSNGKKIKSLQGSGLLNNIFLEETGKTKIVELVNVATPTIISQLQTGEALTLAIKRLKVFVLDENNQYIGMLPDDIGKRLIEFLKGGNSYEAFVRAVKDRRVTIFVKETKRAKRFKNQPSFLFLESALANSSSLKAQKPQTKSQRIKSEDDEENPLYSLPLGEEEE